MKPNLYTGNIIEYPIRLFVRSLLFSDRYWISPNFSCTSERTPQHQSGKIKLIGTVSDFIEQALEFHPI